MTFSRLLHEALDNGARNDILRIDPFFVAAGTGQVSVVKTLLKNGFEWESSFVSNASANNRREVIVWLESTNLKWDPMFAISTASGSGSLEFLEFMFDRGYRGDSTAPAMASLYNQKAILEFFMGKGTDMTEIIDVIAEEGNFVLFDWAISRGIRIRQSTLDAAASGGILEMYMILLDMGLRPGKITIQGVICANSAAIVSHSRYQWPELFDAEMEDYILRFMDHSDSD